MNQEFYTSDYDLSGLHSHMMGVGFSISPVNGLADLSVPFTNGKKVVLSGIQLQYGHYMRSTGLTADIVSIGLNIKI